MEIMPIETLLPEISEGEYASFTFEAIPEADEILTSLEIIKTDFPDSIEISGPTFSGSFSGLFQLPENSLKFRKGIDEPQAVSSFNDLPQKGTVDLYSYTPPSEMLKNFSITVSCKYMKGPVGAELPMELEKIYTQPIIGNWSIFTQMFLNYVR